MLTPSTLQQTYSNLREQTIHLRGVLNDTCHRVPKEILDLVPETSEILGIMVVHITVSITMDKLNVSDTVN